MRDTECRGRGAGEPTRALPSLRGHHTLPHAPHHHPHHEDHGHGQPLQSTTFSLTWRILSWPSVITRSHAYTTHFSFPFKMTNDTLSTVGHNKMQQCRDNISQVISGHSKQTLPWAISCLSARCPGSFATVASSSFGRF